MSKNWLTTSVMNVEGPKIVLKIKTNYSDRGSMTTYKTFCVKNDG